MIHVFVIWRCNKIIQMICSFFSQTSTKNSTFLKKRAEWFVFMPQQYVTDSDLNPLCFSRKTDFPKKKTHIFLCNVNFESIDEFRRNFARFRCNSMLLKGCVDVEWFIDPPLMVAHCLFLFQKEASASLMNHFWKKVLNKFQIA